MNELQIIKKIQSDVARANATDNINDLIAINLKITGNLMFFTEHESNALKEKLIAYNDRKEFEANYCITSESGITKAEKEAVVSSKSYRDKEIETEVTYQAAKSFRGQVNEFTSALTQKIANLRRELELTKFIDSSSK